MSSYLQRWEPEDAQFWKQEGSGRAWGTLSVTTFSLIASFATWFVMSAVVVRLPAIGFKFDTMQLFWLAAMPGLAGGTLRLIHTFLIPIFGTRMTITVATFLKLIPMVWLGFAVQDLNTPYMHFLIIAFLCGMGGGDFSAYMPSTSLFFPKRLQGTAMGFQAGIGNFGVSLTQFMTPWIIGFAVIGAAGPPQLFTKGDVVKGALAITKSADKKIVLDVAVKDPALANAFIIEKDEAGVLKDVKFVETDTHKAIKEDVTRDADGKIVSVNKTEGYKLDVKKNDAGVITDVSFRKVVKKGMWVQNAAFWYIPWLLIAGIICWVYLRSVPMKKPSVGKMISDMTNNKHAYFMVWTYFMTFGSFSGFAASFPIMIRTIYGGFDGAPDPLKYAFLGPLIGSVIRVVGAPLSDKFGGSVFTQFAGLGLIAGCLYLIFGGYLTPTSVDQFGGFLYGMLWIFLMAGIGNFATFRQYPIVYAYNPRIGAQILGWTGAWGAYGPFVFSSLIGGSITKYGSAIPFFWGALAFYVVGNLINWWYYTKPGAERGDWGRWKGTWWAKLSEAERQKYISMNQ